MKRQHEAKVINLKIERVLISQQARLLIDAVPVDEGELVNWYLQERGIVLGGGDVIDFLSWKQAQAKKALDGN